MKRESIFAFNVVLALVLVGMLMVYSASAVRGYPSDGLTVARSMPPFLWQFVYVGIGMTGLIIAARFDYHNFRSRIILWLLVLIAFALLVLVLVYGEAVRGGQRWISIFGFSVQPSEIAKSVLVILLAVKLSENQALLQRFWRGFLPPVAIVSMFAGLVLMEQDLGTPVVMVTVAMLMIVMAGGRWSHVIAACVPAAVGVCALIQGSGYRSERIDAWLDPWKHRSDKGLQLIESLAGFARGGFWGQGLGASEQKLRYLPDAHSDFIFAVWAEEMGLIGSVCLVGLFVLFVIVAIRIAVCARDLFGSLLAGGIVALITVQACINMAVTTGMLPTKGLALPFISAGGSALIVNLAMVGILLNIGIQAVETDDEPQLAVAK
jgi:cell division protein FtsW